MDQDDRPLLSSSFGTAAAAYAEHRPDYAEAAVRWTLERAPGQRVLDLGAGTGKLTVAVLVLGAEVIAVEPDPAMLTELRRALPAVRALPGSAEAIPLPDASVDAVLAGNALHWFDMNVAGPEIARARTRAKGRARPDRAFLASRPETARGEFTLPMLTCVLRLHRR